jgi:integrase
MTQVTPIRDLKGYLEPEQVQKRLIAAASNPRDKAFIGVLMREAMRISEVIQLEESDIDRKRGTLTIVHLKERLKLKCPYCGEILGKRHLFCPGCGNKVDPASTEGQLHQSEGRVFSRSCPFPGRNEIPAMNQRNSAKEFHRYTLRLWQP